MQIVLISATLIFTVLVSAAQSDDAFCEEPPAIPFASVSEVSDEEYALGTTVSYACQFGYSFQGESRTLECVKSDDDEVADWTKPQFSCHPQSCGDPGYITNGRRIGFLFTFPNAVKYECENGYKLIGLSTRYCQTSGSWSGRLPRCEVVTCAPPKEILNGHVSYNSLEYGSELKYKCNKGFRVNTDETVFCTSEGRWSNSDVRCTESACDMPLEPEYGSMQLGGNEDRPRAGSIVIFSCDGNRIPDGPVTSKCLETGEWTFPTPKCLEPCTIPYINEGAIGKYEKRNYYSRQKVFKQQEIGRKVDDDEELSLLCSEGYEVANSGKREEKVFCKQGKWSKELHCEPAFCRNIPPSAENGEVLDIQPQHGGRVSYRCYSDYKKTKNETVVCDFGVWKGNPAICKRTSCPVSLLEFPGLRKGRKSSYRDGEFFKIECDAKYEVANPAELRCLEGKWEGTLPPCIAASCKKPPPSIPHVARVEVLSQTHGSIAKYICQDPYTAVGGSPVQCLFGEWSGRLPRCEDSRCYLKNLQRASHVSSETPEITRSGHRLNVICKQGYSPKSEIPLCLNGKWTQNSVSPCKENDCEVPLLYHGDVKEEKLGDYYLSWFKYVREVTYIKIYPGTIVPPGTTYLLICHNGYSFQGTSIGRKGITCMEGRWFPDPVCLRVGARYVPTTTTQRPPLSTAQQRIPSRTSHSEALTVEITTTPTIPSIMTDPPIKEILEEKQEEPIESGPSEEDYDDGCSCVYSVDDENLVASVDGKRLGFGDKVPDGSKVVFRCHYVGFHRFEGPRENKCENCGSWNTTVFPTCSDPKSGNAVILFDNTLNVSVEGNLEARRGQNVKLRCIAIESAVYPHWNIPDDDKISTRQERKERKNYGDILYVSHLHIEHADIENEGQYECAVGDNNVTAVYLTIIDPNRLCPEFQEEEGISVSYETGRRVNSKALFSCTNQGQQIIGKASLTCQGNGRWSDTPPHCEDVKCKKLKENDMLQIHYTNDRGIGSMATFHCFAPAKRTGVSFTKCLEDGSWADPAPTCRSPPCPVQDLYSGLPPNVVPDMIGATNSTLPSGTVVRMTCDEDFIVVGNPVAKCQNDGTWEVQNILCVSGCPALGKPSESKLIIKPDKDLYKFGETLTFLCPPGMDLNSESQLIMCLKNGWSESILPECAESKEYEYDDKFQERSTDKDDFS